MLKYTKRGYKVLIHSETEKDCNEMLKAGKNVKDIILNNIYEGVLAQVKIKSLLWFLGCIKFFLKSNYNINISNDEFDKEKSTWVLMILKQRNC